LAPSASAGAACSSEMNTQHRPMLEWVQKWRVAILGKGITVKNTFLHYDAEDQPDYTSSVSAPPNLFAESQSHAESSTSYFVEHSQVSACGDKRQIAVAPKESANSIDKVKEDITLPSIGSTGHADGICRPCAHFWRSTGCSRGKDCSYCHICGEDDFQNHRNKRKEITRQRRAAQKGKNGSQNNGTAAGVFKENEATTQSSSIPDADKSCNHASGQGSSDQLPSDTIEVTDAKVKIPDSSFHSVDQHPSVGSIGHDAGSCHPCAHNWRQSGCSKGAECNFCHYCGEQEFTNHKKHAALRRRMHLKAKANQSKSGQHLATAESSQVLNADPKCSNDKVVLPDERVFATLGRVPTPLRLAPFLASKNCTYREEGAEDKEEEQDEEEEEEETKGNEKDRGEWSAVHKEEADDEAQYASNIIAFSGDVKQYMHSGTPQQADSETSLGLSGRNAVKAVAHLHSTKLSHNVMDSLTGTKYGAVNAEVAQRIEPEPEGDSIVCDIALEAYSQKIAIKNTFIQVSSDPETGVTYHTWPLDFRHDLTPSTTCSSVTFHMCRDQCELEDGEILESSAVIEDGELQDDGETSQ